MSGMSSCGDNNMTTRGLIAAVINLLIFPMASALAAETPAPAPAETLVAVSLTAADADAWLDGYLPYALKTGDIAGAVVAIVKDGEVLTERGYGYADVAAKKPVDPKLTLFRPGSVSKLFTWTAVMQLVEAGKIDLDADVNQYLDFKIPETFGKPLTMRDLMTMTPGFEDTLHDEFLSSPKQLFPIGQYVKQNLPVQIFPPGKIVAYSNYGATLAGYIVERMSGEPFDQYVENHIFKPLGMDHSTFAQPLPAALAPDVSVGYHSASNKSTIPFESIEVGPAGSMTTSGTDMAHFMIAQLGDGQYDGASILSPATIALMHTPHSK